MKWDQGKWQKGREQRGAGWKEQNGRQRRKAAQPRPVTPRLQQAIRSSILCHSQMQSKGGHGSFQRDTSAFQTLRLQGRGAPDWAASRWVGFWRQYSAAISPEIKPHHTSVGESHLSPDRNRNASSVVTAILLPLTQHCSLTDFKEPCKGGVCITDNNRWAGWAQRGEIAS